jgi:hypothetical protein
MNFRIVIAVALAALLAHGPAEAGSIAVDELGHGIGTTCQGYMATDPGPSIRGCRRRWGSNCCTDPATRPT